MKKLLSTVSLLFLLLCCNGQLDKFKKNNIQNNQYWDSIIDLDIDLKGTVDYNNKIYKYYDTLGYDSIIVHYYDNGQLYSKTKYRDGIGYYSEYYSNGQLFFKSKLKNRIYDNDKLYYANYDIKGNKFNTFRIGFYKFRKVKIVVHYKDGEKVLKRYYWKTHLLKEYDYVLKKWFYFDLDPRYIKKE